MDVIIPYKDEVNKGLELRYALRSIEKNLTGWDRIVIVSDNPPNWLTGVHFIYMGDSPRGKEYSVYQKLLHCCHVDDFSENFIYWNDDHFLLKPLDVSEIKYWHNGSLSQRNVYNRELAKQQNTLAKLTIPAPLNYDIHTPIIFNKRRFKQIFSGLVDEVCIKSLYSNYRANGDTYEVDGEFMEDCKILGCFPKEEVEAKIKDRLFFSTNAICAPTVEVLEELFPEKSTFEI